MVVPNMTTFPTEKETIYLATLLLQNNLGVGRNEWQKTTAMQHIY